MAIWRGPAEPWPWVLRQSLWLWRSSFRGASCAPYSCGFIYRPAPCLTVPPPARWATAAAATPVSAAQRRADGGAPVRQAVSKRQGRPRASRAGLGGRAGPRRGGSRGRERQAPPRPRRRREPADPGLVARADVWSRPEAAGPSHGAASASPPLPAFRGPATADRAR